MNEKIPGFNVVGQLAALRRYAYSLTRDCDEAEDLVHDALVNAFERQATFKRGGNVRNWLLSVVHNSFVDRLRERKSQARRIEAAAAFADSAAPAAQDQSLRLKQIKSAFFQLPDEQRDALHLVAIEELSYREAADALGIPVGTLMSRISRARASLREFEAGRRSLNSSHLKVVGGRGDDER